MAEYLHAENAVLRKENKENKGVFGKRTRRQSGRRVILRGQFVVTTEPIQKRLADAERKTKKRSTKGKQKRARVVSEEEEVEVVEILEVVEHEEREIQDCIAVQRS
jgi:hypothetical protein